MAIEDAIAAGCRDAGFDLVHPFAVCWWNDGAADEERLPDFGRGRCLGLLVGNTRALWPRLLEAVRATPALRAAEHPLDSYAMERIGRAVAAAGVAAELRWVHEMAPRPVPVQRIAAAVGFATLSPSYLSVHATFGPWLAFRAVVALDTEGPSGPPPRSPDACAACARPCLAPLADAVASPSEWRRWLAVRDACPEGRAHRYDEDQIAYHYSKRRSLLNG